MILFILVLIKNYTFRYDGSKTIDFKIHQILDKIERSKIKDVEFVLYDLRLGYAIFTFYKQQKIIKIKTDT